MCGECNYIINILLSIIISIIVAITVGALFFLGLIPGITTVIWIIFGFAILNLILLFFNARLNRNNEECSCKYGRTIAFSVIGAIILSIISLGIELATGTILVAIIIGLLAFFATVLFINVFLYLLCIIACERNCECNCR